MLKKLTTAVLLILPVAACGCGRDESPARYVPATNTARQAVEAALADWQEGKPPGEISRLTPIAHVIDTHRKPGQTLKSFEILGESPAEGLRCFAVVVKLDSPVAEERLRYYVLGIDPLWVFRQEDYDMITRWDCKPPEAEEAQKTEGAAPDSASDEKSSPSEETANIAESPEKRPAAADQPRQ